MPIFWSWGRTDTLGSGNLFLEEPPRACLRVRPRRFSCRTDEAAIEGEASSAMWVGLRHTGALTAVNGAGREHYDTRHVQGASSSPFSPDPILTSLRFMARVSSSTRSHREPD